MQSEKIAAVSMTRHRLNRAASSVGLLIMASTPAFSWAAAPADQNSTGDSDQPTQLEEVVVTGTHVTRAGFDAPTPTTVVGEQMLETRAPAVLIDALRYLPAMRGAQTADSAGQSSLGPGGE